MARVAENTLTSRMKTIKTGAAVLLGNDPVGTAANPTPLIGAAIIYLAFLWPLVALVSRFENRLGRRSA